MSNIDRSNQADSPSLPVGEFYTGTGRARQTPAPKQRHVFGEQNVRIRGTPESNPLYDAFPTDIISSPRQTQSDFRPISPPQPRLVQNFANELESPYDQPRTYRPEYEQNQPMRERSQQASRYQDKTGLTSSSEADFLMDKMAIETANEDIETANKARKHRRRRVLYNLFDFLAIVMTCVIFGLIYILIKPVQRGFFCDDTSIQYPFRPDTVPMWLLAIYGGVVPIIIFCIVEFWVVRPFQCRRGMGREALRQRQIDYIKLIFHTVFLFMLGIAVCFLITEVGKRTIGRLRPYYITVCNPVWSKIVCTKTIQSASGPVVIPQYIINHNCNSSGDEHDLQEAKLSFPSGHSSYSTYAFIFLFVYFEARLVCPNVQFVKPFLQCLCVAVAFFTCLSRVTDYKHHATDVIGGALIGFCIAVFSAVRVGTYLWELSVYCETDDETKKDRLPKDERISIPGLETSQPDALRSGQMIQEDQEQTARARNGNRSDYDNVVSIQPQHRTISQLSKAAGGQRMSPGRGYEEANV